VVYLPPYKPILFIYIRTTLKCENGVIVNLTTSDVLVPTQEGIKHAKKAGYLED
jgi:hypothetical protein